MCAVLPSPANDAMKVGSALPAQNVQSMKQPPTAINQAITAVPKSPALPQAPTAPIKSPPFGDVQRATLNAPGVQGSAITGLADPARGIVAGQSLVIQGRGFGAAPGRVEIAVQNSAGPEQALSFRPTQWSDTEIRGAVAASSGFGDGKASITIYPAGKSVAEHISSGHAGNNATRNPWRFNFTATRTEQTIEWNSLGEALTSSYAWPEPNLLKHGNGLLHGHAVARRVQAARYGCPTAPPVDKFRIRLGAGFELARVVAVDLNGNLRRGLAAPNDCDVRSVVPSAQFLRSATDGGFVVSPSWDHINRAGPQSKQAGCDGSGGYIGVTKTPLGFDWDNTARDRCAANAEYVLERVVVRGPAGVNPFFGTPTGVTGVIK